MGLWVGAHAGSPGAERELAKLEAHSTQEASRVGGWGWVAWLALLPVLLLMGVLEPLTIALTLGLLGVAATLAFAMGGLKNGQVVGESSRKVEVPASSPISPQDMMATIFTVLGLDRDLSFQDPAGRPTPMITNGKAIRELV